MALNQEKTSSQSLIKKFFFYFFLFFVFFTIIRLGVLIHAYYDFYTQQGDRVIAYIQNHIHSYDEQDDAFITLLIKNGIGEDHSIKKDWVALTSSMHAFVRLDQDLVAESYIGSMPVGYQLPAGSLQWGGWYVTDLYSSEATPLFAKMFQVGGEMYLIVREKDLGLASFSQGSELFVALVDSEGGLIWHNKNENNRVLGERIWSRSFVDVSLLSRMRWGLHRSPSLGLIFSKSIPLNKNDASMRLVLLFTPTQLFQHAYGAISWFLIFSVAAFSIYGLSLHWVRQIFYSDIQVLTDYADGVTRILSFFGGDNLLYILTSAKDTRKKMSALFHRIRTEDAYRVMVAQERSLRSIWRLQKEVYRQLREGSKMNRHLRRVNQEVQMAHDTLRVQKELWQITLEVSSISDNSSDYHADLHRIANAIYQIVGQQVVIEQQTDSGAVCVARVPDEHGGEQEDADSHQLIDQAIRSGSVNLENQMALPLSHAGKIVGGMYVSFDSYMDRDTLLSALKPVASSLAGFMDARISREEIRSSYQYLANKFQDISGIYHHETMEHVSRIGDLSALIARGIGAMDSEVDDLIIFARLHDMGKIKVPLEILMKEGPLTGEEYEIVKNHTTWGAEIVGDASWLVPARNICLTHHEKWDGSGYPNGLKGHEIPIEGAIVAMADIYDALRSPRSYKDGFTHEEVVRIILEGDGRTCPDHFHPEVLKWFRRNHEELKKAFEG